MRGINGIVFDLDGTLVDTKKSIAKSLHELIAFYGVHISFKQIFKDIHLSPYEIARKYVEISWVEFSTKYWKLYSKNIVLSSLFKNVDMLLKELKKRGYVLGIATSLPKSHAKYILQVYGIEKFITGLIAYHDTARHKPYPDPITKIVEKLNLRPDEVLYIGNTPSDVVAGKRAGTYTGAAMWGASQECVDSILAEGPNYVFWSPEEVLDVCGEETFLLPCNFAARSIVHGNCILLNEVSGSDIKSLNDEKIIINFFHLKKEKRIELMKECSKCFKRVILEIPKHSCKICCRDMRKDHEKWKVCYVCNERSRKKELHFKRAFAIGQERGNLAYAIKAFKGVKGSPNIGLAVPLGILVANWIFENIEKIREHGINIIVPVPSSYERKKEIGFDHISKILHVVRSLVDFIDIRSEVISKTKDVKLKDKSTEERRELIKDAFVVKNEKIGNIQGKTILLLDDVLTTGATINECARILKEAGAQEVYALVIARA